MRRLAVVRAAWEESGGREGRGWDSTSVPGVQGNQTPVWR